MAEWELLPADRQILRELAQEKMAVANLPIMEERRRLWKKQKRLEAERPMVLLESFGLGDEFLTESELRCQEDWARNIERNLRQELRHHKIVNDDSVVDPYLSINWRVEIGDYGVEVKTERGVDIEGRTLGFHWEPPLKNLKEDINKLHPRTLSLNRQKTLAYKTFLEEVFAGILPIRIHGSFWWSMGITHDAILLLGLDRFMLLMYDQPESLHQLLSFLTEENRRLAKWLEAEGVLSLNNDNDYIGSGSRGFTDLLPQPDWKEGMPVRLKDLWGLLESQETVGISPAMFAEFILPYYISLSEEFGLVYYGCCEAVHDRWEYVRQLKNLRAVSISPWCKQEVMAEALQNNYVFSRKPAPALISTSAFDEEAIRKEIRTTLSLVRRYNLQAELIMKDLHTVNHKIERTGRWVTICREEIDRL